MSLTLELQYDPDGYGGVILLCDDEEAMRVAKVLRFPWTPNCKVYVTVNFEGLTEENHMLDSQEGGGDAQQGLFDQSPDHRETR